MGKDKPEADPRFAAVRSDPRFARFPRRVSKVDIDERFQGTVVVLLTCRRADEGPRGGNCGLRHVNAHFAAQQSRRFPGRTLQ